MVLLTTICYAQSDFDIAQEFMSKKGVKLVPNERSTTRGTDAPYSVFNGSNDKGFCIVVNGSVVGYDTENTINEDNMSCCLNLLLNSYLNTIKLSKTRGGEEYIPDWWTPRNVTPIKPLLTTQWNQSSPYLDIVKRYGVCVAIAYCQLLHYFKVPQTFIDWTDRNGEIYPITTFNHNLMLDKYEEGKYTEEEAYEVANFINYYCHIDAVGLESCYGMNKNMFWTDDGKRYFEADKCLEQGIPIWTGGSFNNGGHAFIIDGRDSEGKYHVNFGWGGKCDGYYVIPDCPEHTGLYEGIENAYGYLDNDVLWNFYTITPRLFSWDYTSDIAKPNDSVPSINGNVYNLQGVKVGDSLEGLPKGVYIQGRKKYVIK